MKISTKGRYALRLMLDLARNGDGQYISMKEISARQDISMKYLEQIISLLNHAGFVKSVRGAQGGYKLAKPACDYTVGSILRLTDVYKRQIVSGVPVVSPFIQNTHGIEEIRRFAGIGESRKRTGSRSGKVCNPFYKQMCIRDS